MTSNDTSPTVLHTHALADPAPDLITPSWPILLVCLASSVARCAARASCTGPSAVSTEAADLLYGRGAGLKLASTLVRLGQTRDAERDRTGIHVAEAADARARLALGSADDALHPSAPEVEDLVRLLDDKGIRCHSGWDVLADLPDEDVRRELVARLPHLAAGVLLNDPDELERARTLVAARGYEPTSLVTVASTQSFDLDTEPGFDLIHRGEAGFVVPPNPALYDYDAARAECARISERHDERLRQLAELDERYAADQRLKARLLQWREEYPPGKYGELCGLRSTTSENLATAAETTRQRVAEVAEFIKTRTGVREVLASLRTAARLAGTRADRLSRLRERVAQSEAWQQEAVEARVAEEAGKARTTAARTRRDAAVEQVREHERLADRHRATAERLRGEVVEIGGDAGATAERDPSAQPVPVLRRLLNEAQTIYVKAQVGSDLLAEVANADEAAKEARVVLGRFPEPIRAQAEQLLETPQGSDVAGRAVALTTAKSKQDRAGAERDAALGTLNQQTALYKVLPAPSGPVVLPEKPADIAAAQRLLTAAEAALREAVSSVSGKEAACTKASDSLRLVRQVVAGFARIIDNQAVEDEQDTVGSAVVVAPYEGDPAGAWDRHLELAKVLKECGKACVAADKLVNQLAETLRTTASDARFHKLVSAARTQITSVPPSELPQHAGNWRTLLQPRLRGLSEDLAHSDRHRAIIIGRLRGMVENALRTLRQGQRLSRLPAGLGDWSGQEFLRFTFTPVEGDVLTQQLSEVVDEAARGATAKRDGTSVLLNGVRAAAPKGFTVTMLKPDAVLRAERVRVSDVGDVFSGGQHLTAAIMLYCTLAALRANNQGRVHERHSGVLFLDNPIGRASAGYLLYLQRSVAAALGVQLVYTTGLFDAEALGGFPLIVRLRNDADRHAGRRYLSVDPRVDEVLKERDKKPDGTPRLPDTAWLTASRVVLRERRRGD